MGYIRAMYYLYLLTYLLTTSVSGRVPGYPSYYPAGTRVINYPDTAALHVSRAKFGAPPYLAQFDAVNKQLTISLDSDVFACVNC